MSLSITAVAPSDLAFDPNPVAKQPSRPNETAQIKQLASEGHSAQTIAASTGLPESLVAAEIGTTTPTATTATQKSQGTALLALSGHLSIHV